jgi:hypothetical protein
MIENFWVRFLAGIEAQVKKLKSRVKAKFFLSGDHGVGEITGLAAGSVLIKLFTA